MNYLIVLYVYSKNDLANNFVLCVWYNEQRRTWHNFVMLNVIKIMNLPTVDAFRHATAGWFIYTSLLVLVNISFEKKKKKPLDYVQWLVFISLF